MEYSSIMVWTDNKKLLNKIKNSLKKKYGGNFSYNHIIKNALDEYIKSEDLKL